MPFAKDRDLLVHEPLLFRDVAWSSQRLFESAAVSIAGTILTAPGAAFDEVGVAEGAVVVVAGLPLEVVERLSATELVVSRLRARVGGEPIPPGDTESASAYVATFLPQIAIVHEQLMRIVGVEPSLPERRPGVDDVLNPRAIASVEALGALHLIFSAAAAVAGEASTLWMKAALYRDRFAAARARAAVEFDLSDAPPLPGEPVLPSIIRRFNSFRFIRS